MCRWRSSWGDGEFYTLTETLLCRQRLRAAALPWAKLGTTSWSCSYLWSCSYPWSPSYPWSTSYPGPPPIPVPPLLSNPGGISAPFPGAHPSTAMEGLTGIDVSPAGVERGRGRGGESPGFHPFSRCRLLVGRRSRGGCGIVLLVPLALRAGRFAVHGELHRKGQMEREI